MTETHFGPRERAPGSRRGWLQRALGGQRVLGAFFLAFLAAGGLIALASPGTYQTPRHAALLDGEWTAEYQERFDGGIITRDVAASTWAAISYGVFKEGRAGVVVGEDDWLFTTEEFERPPDAAAAMAANLDAIADVRRILAERGTALVLAPVPDKARVYSDRIGRTAYPNGDRYEAFLAGLGAREIPFVDLRQILADARGDAQIYLRTDTHWTPEGAALAAEAIAHAVREAGVEVAGLGETDYRTTVEGEVTHRGDLLTFVPLGPFSDWLGPPADQLERRVTRAPSRRRGEAAQADLFADVRIPVTLVGTSYSAKDAWNFPGALREAFGADVLDVSEEGRGPLVPMLEYLRDDSFLQSPPDLVVWEFPERYLRLVPDLGPFSDLLSTET